MTRRRCSWCRAAVLPLALYTAFAPIAQAARPMITDDARTVAPKACQVEMWARKNVDSREYWALPACNPFGWAELTFGGARTDVDGESARTSDVLLQGKTLFKPLEANGWGLGLALGLLRHPNRPQHRSVGEVYGYVPASVSFADDRVVVHANVGWVHNRDDRRDRPTWGIGAESRLLTNTWLISEVFDQASGTRYQVGVRQWIVPDHVQVDVTYGNRFGHPEARWFTIGLRLISPPFLP